MIQRHDRLVVRYVSRRPEFNNNSHATAKSTMNVLLASNVVKSSMLYRRIADKTASW